MSWFHLLFGKRMLGVLSLLMSCSICFQSPSDEVFGRILVVAGNFTINGQRLNVAQYDLSSQRWLDQFSTRLFQYAADNAVVNDIAVNRSKPFGEELYIAGLFDTTSMISQTQLCSVSRFDGAIFEKVGEGLCSRGDIGSIVVQTIVTGNRGDLFVGGSFATRLWDGRHFVYIYHVARYDAMTAAWLPLSGGGELLCSSGHLAKVNSLVWDSNSDILYIGGKFDTLDGVSITPGLACWSPSKGLVSFPGGGILKQGYDGSFAEVTTMAYDSNTKYLFLAGTFSHVNGLYCPKIAVWDSFAHGWKCLYDNNYNFERISVISTNYHELFVGGAASVESSWSSIQIDPLYKNTVAVLEYPILSHSSQHQGLEGLVHNWTWLPDFYGVPGSITNLLGRKSKGVKSELFIACNAAFEENYQQPSSSVLLWEISSEGKTTISNIGGHNNYPVYGLVSSIALVDFPVDVFPSDSPTIHHDEDYTFFVLLGCVALGAILGLSLTYSCLYRTHEKDFMLLHPIPSYNPSMGIPLKALSGDYENAIDFKMCFERAMKNRHLSTYETLLIINPNEILLSRIIGEGSFGRVWSGHWRSNAVAVKEFVFGQTTIGGSSIQKTNIVEEIVGEAGVMACLRHPKILQLYGCSITLQAIWIVSELCIRGSLKMLLMDMSHPLSVHQSLSILIDIADGMHYLHERLPPIIHRDLKSHNIFITETAPGKFIAKIGDWGSARAIAMTGSKSMTHGVGTACWLSPEVIRNAHFSKASDVYAFGIILWEVHTRQEIYDGLSAAQIIAKVAHEGLRPCIPRDCLWSKLMTQCWKQDPAQRPSFEVILNSLSKLHHKQHMLEQHALRFRDRSGEHPRLDVSVNTSERLDEIISSTTCHDKVEIRKSLKSNPSLMGLHFLGQEDMHTSRGKKSSDSNLTTRSAYRYTEESFAHHLAPEIALVHAPGVTEYDVAEEPPDPLDFLFAKTKVPSGKDSL